MKECFLACGRKKSKINISGVIIVNERNRNYDLSTVQNEVWLPKKIRLIIGMRRMMVIECLKIHIVLVGNNMD